MKIIAHRGNDSIHRENSMDAIINSLNTNYIDGVEFDIRLTKDNKFIINHDPFYHEYFIKQTNSKKLQKLGLNTLEELLDKIDSDKILLIEVKEDDKKIRKTSKYLYQILCKYKLNIYVCSFNYEFIKYFSTKHKDIKCGLIIGAGLNKNHIINNFDFNSVSFRYKGKLPKKETFRWTINSPKNIKSKNENIITDKGKRIYDFINEKEF